MADALFLKNQHQDKIDEQSGTSDPEDGRVVEDAGDPGAQQGTDDRAHGLEGLIVGKNPAKRFRWRVQS